MKTGNGTTIEEAISEVDREVRLRQRCYDRWVSEGRLSAVDARDRLVRLEAAHEFLTALANQTVPVSVPAI
jgi:hypothetical protein